jgi:hypothetical protein
MFKRTLGAPGRGGGEEKATMPMLPSRATRSGTAVTSLGFMKFS